MIRRSLLFSSFLTLIPLIAAEPQKPASEPKILSIYPLTAKTGVSYKAVVRGTGIEGARSIEFSDPGLSGRVLGSQPENVERGEPAGAKRAHLVQLEITIPEDTKPGDHPFRLIALAGLTNELSIRTGAEAVLQESDIATPLNRFPVTINGRIAKRGENDAFWLEIGAGQTLTFEAFSGNPAFDPAIGIYEPSGSWFDPNRLNRVSFNDEPLHFPGLSSNPRLVYTFRKAGRYCVKVGAFSGQGGPDHVYELRITPGVTTPPALHPKLRQNWEERQFTRVFSPEWLPMLARRGGAKTDIPAPESYTAVSSESADLPVMTAPGIVQGRLKKAAEVHRIKLRVDKPQDLAFEIETPAATMPRFNPIVRVLEPGGAEVVTNVHTKLNNNGLYMMKMIQAKTTVSLRNPGEYIIEIRDITTDCSGDDFAYRVLVRPQIPHLGRMLVAEDALSLHSGSTKPLNVTVEREENFDGLVTFSVEGLPAGVSAIPAIANTEEKPSLFNGGKMERYTPKTQKAVLLLVASPGSAPMTAPVNIRVVARPFVNGTLGDPISVKEIPLLVLARSAS